MTLWVRKDSAWWFISAACVVWQGSPELIFRATLYPIEKVRSAQALYGCFGAVRSGVSVCARGWFLIGQPWGPSLWRFHFRPFV